MVERTKSSNSRGVDSLTSSYRRFIVKLKTTAAAIVAFTDTGPSGSLSVLRRANSALPITSRLDLRF